MGIRTEIDNILRVKMYAPRGFCLPPMCLSMYNHKALHASQRIKMEDDLIYYLFEFIDIPLNKQKDIRKFCRDAMEKNIVSIKEYNRMKKRLGNYLKEWHGNR